MNHQYLSWSSRWIVVIAIVLLVISCSTRDDNPGGDLTAPPQIPQDGCLVTTGISLGDISPLVYGVNHGPWAIVTEKTLPLAVDAGIAVIRFPGGNWGDENDLQDYHIDQFVALARQMGSQVFLNVRLSGGSPEDAADLVRYANVEKDYGIRYWGIGNEPTLFATSRNNPDYGVTQFNEEWRQIAEAMKAVDDSILLVGPELHQFGADIQSTPNDPFGLDWMTEFLKANGDLVDIVSIHRYPFPESMGGAAATPEELLASTQEWDEIIPYLRDLILETTGEALPIAVTEVNSHWSNAVGGEATPDSYINAIWWADVLGRLITNDVHFVNYFSLHSNNSIGGYGLLTRTEPRPTYYVYKIYQRFGHNLVFSGCGQANLNAYAALNEDGKLSVILINLGDSVTSSAITIDDESYGLVSAYRLEESGFNTLDIDSLGDLGNFNFPEKSITLLEWE